MMNPSQEYFTSIDQLAQQEMPDDVMARACHSLLDYLAVTCAGAVFQKEKLEGYFAFAEPEEGRFKATGAGTKCARLCQVS